MSYQVLARKYRPRSFQTLVGQEHVVRALTHALEQQRLHHAYLFTGTRGVGKTTLSRILAKALNCETGITATPCGRCDACVAIDAGRFVDYIEMDAASNRGVDEMAQLLEQAVYAPSDARFKVYMIDEVHMLTNHAFNSMLKTLEEPPAHVKFILATTDPQKIPVTVLSRCLQFNLKQMPPLSIVEHLQDILGQEQIGFEIPALRLLAKAAQGSMRDALSLTDQAIAYAAGPVSLDAVQGMLGALDQSYLITILDALITQDGSGLLAVADQMAARSLSYKAALQDLATMLHQISIAQLVPAALPEDLPERAELLRIAELISGEQIHLFYQIAVHGRNELALAPDEYAGFSMTLLRMLAFRPVSAEFASLGGGAGNAPSLSRPAAAGSVSSPAPVHRPSAPRTAFVSSPPASTSAVSPAVAVEVNAKPASARVSPAMAALEAARSGRGMRGAAVTTASGTPAPVARAVTAPAVVADVAAKPVAVRSSFSPPPWEELDAMDAAVSTLTAPVVAEKKTELIAPSVDKSASGNVMATQPEAGATTVLVSPPPVVSGVRLAAGEEWDGNWPALVAGLPLRGVVHQLAQQSELTACDVTGQQLTLSLRVPLETLLSSGSAEKLTSALADQFSQSVRLEFDIGAVQRTAHAEAIVERARRQQLAESDIQQDPVVQLLMQELGANLVSGSVRPIRESAGS